MAATGTATGKADGLPLVAASAVTGTDVFGTDGVRLGHVEDLMLDKARGEVVYALLAFGGLLGLGARFHPVPWGLLAYDPARDGYVVPLDRQVLERAPHFGRDGAAFDDPEWRERVLLYYRLPAAGAH